MFKTIKESISITNNYLVIATPLIFFTLISSTYLYFTMEGNSSQIGILFSIILFFSMLCAFLAGWFFMIKRAIQEPNMENKDKLIFEFPSGVGEYFLPVFGMIVNIVVFSTIVIVLGLLIGRHFIGDIGFSYDQLLKASESIETMKAFLTSLSSEQLLKINQWNILLFLTFVFNYFILMFTFPALIYKNKNPFLAFFIGIKDIFCRHFFKNILLFLLIIITYTILSVILILLKANFLTYFIFTLVRFYYITFMALLMFNYYYSNYIKIGSVIDKNV